MLLIVFGIISVSIRWVVAKIIASNYLCIFCYCENFFLIIIDFISQEVPNFLSHFVSASSFESKPLKGLRVGLICETIGDGVDAGVISAIRAAASHFEELGCSVNEVLLIIFPIFLNDDFYSHFTSLY